MCTKTYGPYQVTATTNDNSVMRVTPVTGWLPAQSMQFVKVLTTLLEKTGDGEVTPAYQTAATDVNSPDGWAAIESTATWLTTAGSSDCTAVSDLSTATDSKFYIRFGVGYKNVATTNFNQVNAEVRLSGSAS